MWEALSGHGDTRVVVESLVLDESLSRLVRVSFPLSRDELRHWISRVHRDCRSREMTQLAEHGAVNRLLFLKDDVILAQEHYIIREENERFGQTSYDFGTGLGCGPFDCPFDTPGLEKL